MSSRSNTREKNRIQIEICVFSLEAAKKAATAGADRLELCSNPSEGGTTANQALIKAVCREVNIPVYPIIRPRGGDFNYSHSEFEQIKEDIDFCKKAGCKGIATSILSSDNQIDKKRLNEIVELASPLGVTFVRGFDLTQHPEEALKMLIDCGCERVLTSGQAEKAIDGLPLLKRLNTLASKHISVMPGSGINARNIKQIIDQSGVIEIHASARYLIPNTDTAIDKFGFGQQISCNEQQIKEMREIANQFNC
jgi:copper homeostasis protein